MVRAFLCALLLGQVLRAAPVSAQAVSLVTTGWSAGPDAWGPATYSGAVDQPATPASTLMTGWIVDTTAQGWSGVDAVQIWNGLMGAGGQRLEDAAIQLNRPDVAAALNNQYWDTSGFAASVPPGTFTNGAVLYIYAHTPDKGWWYTELLSSGTLSDSQAGPRLSIETPTPLATVHSGAPYVMRGYAFDPSATQGTGVDRVEVYLNGDRNSGVFIGDASLGSFDKYASALGVQFANAGWQLTFQPNSWLGTITDNQLTQMTIYAHSAVTGRVSQEQTTIVISVP